MPYEHLMTFLLTQTPIPKNPNPLLTLFLRALKGIPHLQSPYLSLSTPSEPHSLPVGGNELSDQPPTDDGGLDAEGTHSRNGTVCCKQGPLRHDANGGRGQR